MSDEAQCVFVAEGEIQAQQVRAFLESEGIQSAVRGEALRLTHGFSLDGLGRVEILVLEADAAKARELLASANAGALRIGDDEPIH